MLEIVQFLIDINVSDVATLALTSGVNSSSIIPIGKLTKIKYKQWTHMCSDFNTTMNEWMNEWTNERTNEQTNSQSVSQSVINQG